MRFRAPGRPSRPRLCSDGPGMGHEHYPWLGVWMSNEVSPVRVATSSVHPMFVVRLPVIQLGACRAWPASHGGRAYSQRSGRHLATLTGRWRMPAWCTWVGWSAGYRSMCSCRAYRRGTPTRVTSQHPNIRPSDHRHRWSIRGVWPMRYSSLWNFNPD